MILSCPFRREDFQSSIIDYIVGKQNNITIIIYELQYNLFCRPDRSYAWGEIGSPAANFSPKLLLVKTMIMTRQGRGILSFILEVGSDDESLENHTHSHPGRAALLRLD
jgi:hypothetical protein